MKTLTFDRVKVTDLIKTSQIIRDYRKVNIFGGRKPLNGMNKVRASTFSDQRPTLFRSEVNFHKPIWACIL